MVKSLYESLKYWKYLSHFTNGIDKSWISDSILLKYSPVIPLRKVAFTHYTIKDSCHNQTNQQAQVLQLFKVERYHQHEKIVKYMKTGNALLFYIIRH